MDFSSASVALLGCRMLYFYYAENTSHILGELQNTAHSFGIVNEGSIARIISSEDLKTDKKAVRIDIDDLDKARTALNQAGVKILGEVQESSSLEDYYFKLLGGKEND